MKKLTHNSKIGIPISKWLLLLIAFLFSIYLPAQVTIQSTHSATGTSGNAATNSITNVPAGALLVLVVTGEDDENNCSISNNAGLTFTKRSDAQASISSDAEIWTAVFTAGGSITIDSDFPNTSNQASVCYVVTGQESSLGGASANATAQSAPSVNITTTRANSIIIGGISDWNAINGSSRTYRDAATETYYHRVSGAFTTYGFYKQAASIGAYTEGLTAPTGQSSGTVLYEIRGLADTNPPSSFTLSAAGETSTTISLSWTAATDNVGVTGYDIYRNGTYVTTTTNLSYTLTGLNPCTQYSIYVKAKDAANNSTNSNTISHSTTGCSSCVSIVNISTATGTSGNPASNALTNVPAGALLVLVVTGEDDENNCSISNNAGLTFTKRSDAGASLSSDAEIWTAVFTAGGSITIDSDFPNTSNQASVCYVVTGQESTLGGASANATAQGAPSVNITTTRANSIIIGGTSDWNAINGSSRTYRDAATETFYHRVSGAFTTYGFYKPATTVGTYTEGLTAPTGQAAGTALYEVRCAPAPDSIAPTAPTVSSPTHTSTTITVAMTGATDNVGVTGYNVYVTTGGNTTAHLNVGTPYLITGLTPSTSYDIYVKARDAAGNLSSNSNTITVATDALSLLAIEGFGADADDGTGSNTVYHVTNLVGDNNATNTTSGCLEAGIANYTTIVFDVDGTIEERLHLSNVHHLVIDASGRNITIDNNGEVDAISIDGSNAHHIVIKNLHVTDAGGDGINVIDGAHDIAIVNCTSYGNGDGNIDIANDSYNVTVQYCILGGGKEDWSGDMLITSYNVSVHHNLFVPATPDEPGERCPFVHANYSTVGSPNADIRNNLIWRWGRDNATGSGYGTGVGYNATANAINNYYYSSVYEESALNTDDGYGSGATGKVYASGNVSGNAGVDPNSVSNHAIYSIPQFATVTTHTACEAAALVLENAGPSERNSVDDAFVNSVTLYGCGGGLIANRRNAPSELSNDNKQKLALVTSIFPNPAFSQVTVAIEAAKQETVTIVIMDISGKMLRQQKVNAVKGMNTVPVDITKLSKGTYLVKVVCQSDCETAIGKFIKL